MFERGYLDLYYKKYREYQEYGLDKGEYVVPYAIQFDSKRAAKEYERELEEMGYERVSGTDSLNMLVNTDFKRYGYDTKESVSFKRNDTVYSMLKGKNVELYY